MAESLIGGDAPVVPEPASPAAPAATPTPPAAPAAPVAPVAPVAGGAWYDKLPADLQTDKLKGFKSLDDFAKSHLHLEQAVGRKGILLPKDGAKPEEVAEFRKALGVPDRPEEYDWKAPEGFDPQAAGIDMAATQKAFHAANLSKDQARDVMNFYAAQTKAIHTKMQDEMTAEAVSSVTKLKQEWGAEYDANLAKVQDVAKRTGLGDVFKLSGLGNNLAAIKALAEIAKYLPEDESKGGKATGGTDGLKAELESIKRNPAFSDRLNPAYGAMMARREAIFKELSKGQ